MDLYHVALYVHFIALMIGICATTLAHFAMFQAEGATTVGELGRWMRMMPRVTKLFPVALATFFVSGGYMASKTWGWQSSFVQVGTAAIIILMVNGILIGKRMSRMPAILSQSKPGDNIPAAAIALLCDPVVSTLPWVNGMLVMGVAFVMTTKPALTGALGVLLVAIAVGLLLANRFSPRRSHATSTEAAAERAG
jgi:hypothetical protein